MQNANIVKFLNDNNIKIDKQVIEEAHEGEILTMLMSKDGSCFYSAGLDKEIKQWDCKTLKLIASIPAAHKDEIRTMLMSEDGSCFYSAGVDKEIQQWDCKTLKLIASIQHAHTSDIRCVNSIKYAFFYKRERLLPYFIFRTFVAII